MVSHWPRTPLSSLDWLAKEPQVYTHIQLLCRYSGYQTHALVLVWQGCCVPSYLPNPFYVSLRVTGRMTRPFAAGTALQYP